MDDTPVIGSSGIGGAREGGGMGIYEEFGVAPLINASDYVTRHGAAPMLPEVVAAMAEAARSSVAIAELEDAAGRAIAEATGAESGYVTAGSAAALALAAAACLAGTDRQRINRLPDATGLPDAIVIPGPHRDSYDRCFRIAGARIVTAGTPERCTPADLAAAIDDRTVAIGWFSDYEAALPLPPVVAVARERGVPTIVDAAIALPPPENLRRFIAEGADLIAYSAGKDLRRPDRLGGAPAPGLRRQRRHLGHSCAAAQPRPRPRSADEGGQGGDRRGLEVR
jgi:D-glucosaminate-6-phosphate ammonia-lyase